MLTQEEKVALYKKAFSIVAEIEMHIAGDALAESSLTEQDRLNMAAINKVKDKAKKRMEEAVSVANSPAKENCEDAEDKDAAKTLLSKIQEKYSLLFANFDRNAPTLNEKEISQINKLYRRFFEVYAGLSIESQDSFAAKKEEMKIEQKEFRAWLQNIQNIAPIKLPNPNILNEHKKEGNVRYQDLTEISKVHLQTITNLFSRDKRKLDASDIDSNDIEQSTSLSDCSFLSALAALALARPEAIRDLITPKEDGTYDVRLHVRDKKFLAISPDLEPIIINVTTEIPLDEKNHPVYAQEGDKELWVMLVEKAYAVLNGGDYVHINKSNPAYKAMENLTGNPAKKYKLAGLSKEELLPLVDKAIKEKRLATATSKNKLGKKDWEFNNTDNPDYAIGITAFHVFYILSVDTVKQELNLKNPHFSGEETPDFPIPVKEFYRYFDCIDIEL